VFDEIGLTQTADTILQIIVNCVDFEDFWYRKVYGQGTFGNSY